MTMNKLLCTVVRKLSQRTAAKVLVDLGLGSHGIVVASTSTLTTVRTAADAICAGEQIYFTNRRGTRWLAGTTNDLLADRLGLKHNAKLLPTMPVAVFIDRYGPCMHGAAFLRVCGSLEVAYKKAPAKFLRWALYMTGLDCRGFDEPSLNAATMRRRYPWKKVAAKLVV